MKPELARLVLVAGVMSFPRWVDTRKVFWKEFPRNMHKCPLDFKWDFLARSFYGDWGWVCSRTDNISCDVGSVPPVSFNIFVLVAQSNYWRGHLTVIADVRARAVSMKSIKIDTLPLQKSIIFL